MRDCRDGIWRDGAHNAESDSLGACDRLLRAEGPSRQGAWEVLDAASSFEDAWRTSACGKRKASTTQAHAAPSNSYSVGQLAALSGVSARTLRYYEEIGLLSPRRAPNGYRVFGSGDLEALQRILIFRSCGIGLEEIGRMLSDPCFDVHAALLRHLDTLEARKREVDSLIATVGKMIASLEGEYDMADQERFEGLKRQAIEENERAYGCDARMRYGDAAIDAANDKLLAMTEGQWDDAQALSAAINEKLAEAMEQGDVRSPVAGELARMHKAWICAYWPDGMYSREAHLGLADGYLADERFVAYYDGAAGEGATKFLRDVLVANL